MNVRERMEQEEYEFLSPQAQKAAETKGRPEPEDDNDVRTCYQRDADRILHSKSFRRLMHKTQVFLSPEGDHYRTRMTHTLEVARIARTICRGLRLNQDLAEAAAYGHDLGHTPFGHAGEKALSSMLDKPFRHNEQSLRVVDKLERDGAGLNLTYEVRMGILGHTGDFIPETLEGQIVRTSDRIAYINHDIDDAMRRDPDRGRYPGADRGNSRPLAFTADQHTGREHDRKHDADRHARYAAGRGAGHGSAAHVHVCPRLYESRRQG